MANQGRSEAKIILKFAIPIMLSSAIGVFGSLVQSIILGRENSSYLYIIAIYIPIQIIVLAVLETYQSTTYSVTSRFVGAGTIEQLAAMLLSLLIFAIFSHFILFSIFSLLSFAYFDFLNVNQASRNTIYMFISIGILSSFLITAAGILSSASYVLGLGLKLTFTSMLITLSCFYLTWWLLEVSELGIFTLFVSQSVSGIVVITITACYLYRKKLRVNFHQLKHQAQKSFKSLLAIGGPVFLGLMLIFTQSICVNAALAYKSELAVAGFGIATRINSLLIIPAIGIGAATAIRLNLLRNWDLDTPKNVTSTASTVLLLGVYFVVSLFLFLFRSDITSVFSPDNSLTREAARYFFLVAPSLVCFGPLLGWLTIQEQTGDGKLALSYNLLSVMIVIMGVLYVIFSQAYYENIYRVISLMNFIGGFYVAYTLFKHKKRSILEYKIKSVTSNPKKVVSQLK